MAGPAAPIRAACCVKPAAPGPCAVPTAALPGGPVPHVAKQERLNADASRCTQKHADGPEAGMAVHGRHRTAGPGSRADAVAHVPSACSACICLHLRSTLLAASRAAPAPQGSPSTTRKPGKNPMHQTCAPRQAVRKRQVSQENRQPEFLTLTNQEPPLCPSSPTVPGTNITSHSATACRRPSSTSPSTATAASSPRSRRSTRCALATPTRHSSPCGSCCAARMPTRACAWPAVTATTSGR